MDSFGASKTPLYDVNGEITGLLGYFIDKRLYDKPGEDTSRRDILTGLLNSRGISEEAEIFNDEYYLRGTDFVRIHISINDFNTINQNYGFDFGDKVLTAFGNALKQQFGLRAAVGRYAGRRFVVLQQIENREEAHQLRDKIKATGDSVREVDGKPITLYLSVGYALFSEYLDLEGQEKNAELRLHADHDQNISAESRIDHAMELFALFDDLPVPYSVYHVTREESSGRYDAVFFGKLLTVINLSISYATWTAVGTVGASLIGLFCFGQKLSAGGWVGVGLICVGVFLLNLLGTPKELIGCHDSKTGKYLNGN